MTLPFTVASLDEVDEKVRDLYIEDNGTFRLNVSGYEDTSSLKKALHSEREAVKGLRQELSGMREQLGQFEGLDIDAVKQLLEKAGQDEETRLIAEGKVDEVFNRRTERLKQSYEKQLQEANERAEKAEARAKRYDARVLSDAIRSAALKAGALAEATEDIILRARDVFKLDDEGNPVALDSDGQVIYGKDGTTPLTPLEWAESLQEAAPHLWPRAQGAGQTGDRGGRAGKKWSDFTETERAQIARDDPEAFKQLMKTRGD